MTFHLFHNYHKITITKRSRSYFPVKNLLLFLLLFSIAIHTIDPNNCVYSLP